MDHELARLLSVAEEAAERGGLIVAERARRGVPPGPAERKAYGGYVTDVDRRSEDAIRTFLGRASPGIPVLGEEEGGSRGARFWAVDPLDGTTNFLLGFPVVAVSVALVVDDRPVVGAITAPLLGLSFSAARGHGAVSGGRRLAVSIRPADRAVVATGPPFRRKELLPRWLLAAERVLREGEDLRRAGAAALDLAWVAAGVFDGYLELNMNVWDVAAGALLVEEAGGVVTDWSGGSGYLRGEILAGSPPTHELLLRAASPGRQAGFRPR